MNNDKAKFITFNMFEAIIIFFCAVILIGLFYFFYLYALNNMLLQWYDETERRTIMLDCCEELENIDGK